MKKPRFDFIPALSIKDRHIIELASLGLDFFSLFLAPASGPRGITLTGFEHRFLQAYTNKRITGKKLFVGASAGAMRHVALLSSLAYADNQIQRDVTREWTNAFSALHYKYGDLPSSLAEQMKHVYASVCPVDIVDAVLSHPTIHLAIMVTSLPRYAGWSDIGLNMLFGYFVWLRVAGDKKQFNAHTTRLCFYTGPKPSILDDGSGLEFHKLTRDNISHVLHASSSIPNIQGTKLCTSMIDLLVRCSYIEGIGKGLFIDGAFTDFMLSTRLKDRHALLVSDVAGGKAYASIFDRFIPGKHVSNDHFDHCSVVCITEAFLDDLVGGSAPSVNDWFKREHIVFPERRIAKWRHARELSVATFPTTWQVKQAAEKKILTREQRGLDQLKYIIVLALVYLIFQ